MWQLTPLAYVGAIPPHPDTPASDPSGGDSRCKLVVSLRKDAYAKSAHSVDLANAALTDHVSYKPAFDGVNAAITAWQAVKTEALAVKKLSKSSGGAWLEAIAKKFEDEANLELAASANIKTQLTADQKTHPAPPPKHPPSHPSYPPSHPYPPPPPPPPGGFPPGGPILPGGGPIYWPSPEPPPPADPVATIGYLALIGAVVYLGYRVFVRKS